MSLASRSEWAGVVDYAQRQAVETPKSQYELPGLTGEYHPGGIPAMTPPLWHAVVTAWLGFGVDDWETLRLAQERLTAALAVVERVYPLLPSGLYTRWAMVCPTFANVSLRRS